MLRSKPVRKLQKQIDEFTRALGNEIKAENNVKLACEVVDWKAVINISPFAMRYITNRRGDLNI